MHAGTELLCNQGPCEAAADLSVPVVVGWEFPAIEWRGNATGSPLPHSSMIE